MRYVLAFSLVVAALAGCNEPQEPNQSTEVTIPPRSEGEMGAVTPSEVGPTSPDEEPVEVAPEPSGWDEAPTDPEPDPDPTLPAGARTYTIQKGDTLWSIAKRLYGDGQRWKDIVAMNPDLKPEAMRVGQVIKVPAN